MKIEVQKRVLSENEKIASKLHAEFDDADLARISACGNERFTHRMRRNHHARRETIGKGHIQFDLRSAEGTFLQNIVQVPDEPPPCERRGNRGQDKSLLRVGVYDVVFARGTCDLENHARHGI